MLRILVADDERTIRRGLAAMLQRDIKEDIELLEAGNGADALKLVRQRPVDLIITDICMPLCNGLEFVEQLRQSQQNMTVIIVSGYANFEYASQAVRLGVKDYVMKPVDKKEFLELVENCIADIHKKQEDAEQKALRQIRLDQITDEVQREALRRLLEGRGDEFSRSALSEAGLDFSASGYCCAALEHDAVSGTDRKMDLAVRQQARVYISAQHAHSLTAVVRPGCIGILLWGAAETDSAVIHPLLRNLVMRVERLCRVHAVCGVSGAVYSDAQIPAAFERSCRAADRKLNGGREPVLVYGPAAIEGKLKPVFSPSLLEHWEPNCAKQILQAFRSGMETPLTQISAGCLRSSYELLMETVQSRCSGLPFEECPHFKPFSDLWSYYELYSEVEAMLQQLDSIAEEPPGGQAAKEIIHYTIDHFTEDIDLNYLAARFGKTPGYIGKLFRKGSQMGFNEFVMNERIKLAKKLLQTPGLSVQQVGEMCGYHNPKYFSTSFKKVTGMSPKSYRERGNYS